MALNRQDGSPTSRDARRQFGRQAAHYVTSASHAGGASLDIMVEWADPKLSDIVLDVATGAGFAALALAPLVRLAVATDITPEMLAQTRQQAAQRGLGNVALALTAAEDLAVRDHCIDIVTCRVAAHHFLDVPRFVREVHRVCKPGGRVMLVDTVAPEDKSLGVVMNDLELRRDPSHVHNYAPSDWKALFEQQSFDVRRLTVVPSELEFDDWVRRSATPSPEVAVLRRLFEDASPEVTKAFNIRREGELIRFAWGTVVLEARKPISD